MAYLHFKNSSLQLYQMSIFWHFYYFSHKSVKEMRTKLLHRMLNIQPGISVLSYSFMVYFHTTSAKCIQIGYLFLRFLQFHICLASDLRIKNPFKLVFQLLVWNKKNIFTFECQPTLFNSDTDLGMKICLKMNRQIWNWICKPIKTIWARQIISYEVGAQINCL